ncbi:MAG: hypothetical protein ABIK45_02860 [Pseudomonadota bacterium]
MMLVLSWRDSNRLGPVGPEGKTVFSFMKVSAREKIRPSKQEDVVMGFFWFFLGLGMTIAALVVIKISSPTEK